jgi:aryl-alcohol dehydrogenase-like predicted oxidoreductase
VSAGLAAGGRGLKLQRVALGCGNFGGVGSAPEFFGQGLTQDQAFELMDAAWESGIAHFDTADAYGGGRSERAIGRWIASRGVTPQLTTKTFNPTHPGDDNGLRPERIARHLLASLDRLAVHHVDLYLAHDFDPDVPIADTIGAFEEAVARGAVQAYGVSNFNAGQLSVALRAGSPAAVQNGYSLLQRGDEEEMLPLCARHSVAYLAFSPLAGGWLTGKYRRGEPFPDGSRMTQRPGPYRDFIADRTFAVLGALESLAARRGTSMAGLALGWLLSDQRVTQIVIGPGRPAHLAPVREAIQQPVTDSERAEIEGILA